MECRLQIVLIILVTCGIFVENVNVKENNACYAIPWLHKCEDNGYDKMIPPQWHSDGSTTKVEVEIFVESVGNFKAGSMDYDMDIYFVEFWRDERLKHNYSSYLLLNEQAQINKIWLPDLYFSNSKSASYNYVTVPNFSLKLFKDGSIRYSIRIHLKVSCHMNLIAYPIDTQRCSMKIVSYGNPKTKMDVSWRPIKEAIQLNTELVGIDLKVVKVDWGYCNGTYFEVEFSCLLATFYLVRNIGYSLLQIYIPTTLIVVLSWISFWIDPLSVPGRVGLAVTTLLTLSTHAISMHYQLPPVSYAKAQDIWFAVCILFLFAALVEFALVNMYTRRCDEILSKMKNAEYLQKRRTALTSISQNDVLSHVTSRTAQPVPNQSRVSIENLLSINQAWLKYRTRSEQIDKMSRIIFPCVFIVFCSCYWCIYLFAVQQHRY